MSGETKLDEPFAVEILRHFLENFDAPEIILDQIVVGREDGGDFALFGERGEVDFLTKSYFTIKTWYSRIRVKILKANLLKQLRQIVEI